VTADAALLQAGADALAANDLTGASRSFGQIVAGNPRAHAAWNALSVIAVRSGAPDVAVEHSRRALEFNRRNAVYLNNLAVAYGELGQLAECEAALRRALKAQPAYTEGLYNLAKVLFKQGRLEESSRCYERAHAIDPNFPELRRNLAITYRALGRANLGVPVLRAAERANADDEQVASILAGCLLDSEGADAAIAYLHRVVEQHPDWRDAHMALALIQLALGQWRAGWREYYWRPNIPLAERARNLPDQLPERLERTRVLLKHEQGLGDILFFLRFAPELAHRGAKLVVSCPEKLVGILSAVDALSEITASPEGDDGFDLRIWMGDLPLLLEGSGTPPPLRLKIDGNLTGRWAERLAQFGPAPYLGLTWRAGTNWLAAQEFGRSRALISKAIPPDSLGATVQDWPGTLFSLQRAPDAADLAKAAHAANAPVHDLSALNDDLPEMRAVLSLIHEYVCVSNTNVHLAAGVGKSARVLVPFPPEWRWMQAGNASPWFPGFPIYRERAGEGWSAALDSLRSDLMAQWRSQCQA
jgi:tetratricopeptide (TPR) repeat protein